MRMKFSASQMWTVALVLLFGFNIATTTAAPEAPTRSGSSGNITNSFINDNLGLYLLCRSNVASNNQIFKIPAEELPRLTNDYNCPAGEYGLTLPSQYTYCPGCIFTTTLSFNSRSVGANFGGAIFTGTNFVNKNFQGSNFASAVFSAANFTSASLTATNFSGAVFNGTGNNLTNARFAYANLQGANLSNQTATNANFIGINGYYSNFSNTLLNNTDFTAADLRQSIIQGVDLRDASMPRVNLSNVYAFDADFTDAFMASANLTDGYLISANLAGTNLDNANFTRANLAGATGVPSITGAIFDNTRCPNNTVVTSPAVCTFTP